MYVLKDRYDSMITGFSSEGMFQSHSNGPPLQWHSLSDLVKFLRIQPQLGSNIPAPLTIHRIVDQPVQIVTEMVK